MTKPVTMTLNQIRAFSPCKSGWEKLLSALGKTQADDEPIELAFILKSNGIQDAIWCMRVNWFEHKSLYMQFVNNCVERAKWYGAATAATTAYSATAAETTAAETAAGAAAVAAYAAAAGAAERQKQTEDLLQLLQSYQ
jgi:hypothetical protein